MQINTHMCLVYNYILKKFDYELIKYFVDKYKYVGVNQKMSISSYDLRVIR